MSNPLETAVGDLYLTRYLSYASLTILLYDHATTLSDEIFLIWPAKVGLIKLVFFFNRYSVPVIIAFLCFVFSGQASFLNDRFCQTYLTFAVCYAALALLTTTFVVTTRVYALWGTQRHAFIFLAGLWLIHMVADVVVVARDFLEQFPHIGYLPAFNICRASIQGSWTVWLNGIIFNALMISLLIWAWLSTPRNTQTPLMALIVRGGCAYFVAIFSAMLFILLVWRYGRPSQAMLPLIVVWTTTTIAISRLLLSMKDVQGPDDWGQQANIVVPDLELASIPERGPVCVISRFSEDDDLPGKSPRRKIRFTATPKISEIGRYDG